MSKFFKVLSNIVLWLILIILAIYVGLKLTNKIGIYKVLTGSMESGIHPGDYIVVLKVDDYKKGDIVTYEKDGNYITHRIVKITDDKVITKGDANNTIDESFKKQDIVGKLIFKNKILNYIVNYKYYIITGFLFLYSISFIISNLTKKKDEKENNEENDKTNEKQEEIEKSNDNEVSKEVEEEIIEVMEEEKEDKE